MYDLPPCAAKGAGWPSVISYEGIYGVELTDLASEIEDSSTADWLIRMVELRRENYGKQSRSEYVLHFLITCSELFPSLIRSCTLLAVSLDCGDVHYELANWPGESSNSPGVIESTSARITSSLLH